MLSERNVCCDSNDSVFPSLPDRGRMAFITGLNTTTSHYKLFLLSFQPEKTFIFSETDGLLFLTFIKINGASSPMPSGCCCMCAGVSHVENQWLWLRRHRYNQLDFYQMQTLCISAFLLRSMQSSLTMKLFGCCKCSRAISDHWYLSYCHGGVDWLAVFTGTFNHPHTMSDPSTSLHSVHFSSFTFRKVSLLLIPLISSFLNLL